ncbi:MAG: restriction endonuclease subunit S [Betaproteobacteria bacterium]|nr:restriction endonuclease subunit S [Betaproteobacteria bacterium]
MPETLARHIKVLSGWAFPSDGFDELEGLPLIRIRDLASGTTEVKFKGSYDPRYVIDDGDVLIGMDGDFSVEKWAGGPALLNQRVCKVETASENLDQGFLYWYLMPHVAEIHRKTPQTTVRHLAASSLGHIVAPPISVAEQRTVNEILDTLDTTIRQTEAIIEKLKQVKQGLLHDLLTRGIDANGELRPPQSQAPHLYKDSPLGWIPWEWEAITLGAAVGRSGGAIQTGPFGSQLHAHEYVPEGVPVIMPQDILDGAIDRAQIAMVSDRKAIAMARHQVATNDVVFSRRGDLSRCAAIGEHEIGWLCGTGCLLVRLPKTELLGVWLSLVYRQPLVQAQVLGRAVGSTMANLNTGILSELHVTRPPVEEQSEIDSRIRALSSTLEAESDLAAKLRLEKSGLMDDLLTGHVRVTPLLA